MAKKPATLSQVGSLITRLLTIFLGLITEKNKKLSEIEHDKIQEIIDSEDKDIVDAIIQFINNGWKLTVIYAARVLDLNAEPKLPFGGATLKERIGMSGKVALDLTKVKAINKLKKGENYITGHEFKKRLIADKTVFFNSNFIDFLVANQNDADVKAFLDQYKDKVLFDFGDTFADSSGHLCVRSLLVDGGVWVSDSYYLADGWSVRYRALVLAKDTQ